MDFKNKNIAIIGFAREGESSLRFLLSENIDPSRVTILDKNPLAKIPEGLSSFLGDNYLSDLSRYDILIVTPGLSPYTKEIQGYRGIITSQTGIFFERYTGKTIGVTATKGKSTTVTLIRDVLVAAGKNVRLVGNIGAPVLDEIDWKNPPDWVVYELSSHMLEYCHPRLEIAVLGNIYPDHLVYHCGFENYKNAKLRILDDAKYIVCGKQVIDSGYIQGIPDSVSIIPNDTGFHLENDNLFFEKRELMCGSEITLLGEHNKRNILSVFAVGKIVGIEESIIQTVCSKFSGLPHRLQYVGTFHDIAFYDDAISTTPESTIEGIRAFQGKVDTIFLGGQDRGYDFANLAHELKKNNIRNIVLFPDSGSKILPLLDKSHNILSTASMKEAVSFAYRNTLSGKICLLSTASPSYNIWKNYEAKGDDFQDCVKNYDQ